MEGTTTWVVGQKGTTLLATLPETNMLFAPENGWMEDQFPFGMVYFQVRTVSFREGSSFFF